MPRSVTRYTYCVWDWEAGNRTEARRHVGLLFSRTEPWIYPEVVEIVRQHPPAQEFLRFPEHPYFILPCSPTDRDISKKGHNLYRQPANYKRTAWRKPSKPTYFPPTNNEHALRDRKENVRTADALVQSGVCEWRYLVVPMVDTILSRELHPSTLHHTFILVWENGHKRFRYQQLWDKCPLVQGMFHGYHGCPKCDLRGIKCVSKWFSEVLEESEVPVRFEELQYGTSRTYIRKVDEDPQSYMVPRDWNSKYRKILEAEDDVFLEYGDPEQQAVLPGINRLPPGTILRYVSRGKCRIPGTSMILDKSEYTPALTTLDPKDIAKNQREYNSNAKKAAKTKRRQNSTCGTGDEACVLRCQECPRWKSKAKISWTSASPCKTRWSSYDEMLDAGVSSMKEELSYEERDFAIAFASSTRRFYCVNPDTGLKIQVEYGGLRISDGEVQHVLVREEKGGFVQELYRGPWEGLRQFVRRWSPWNQKRFWCLENKVRDVSVDDAAKVFYAECANIKYFWGQSAWGGYSRRSVVAISVGGSYDHYTAKNTKIHVRTVYGHNYWFHNPGRLAKEQDWSWFNYIPD